MSLKYRPEIDGLRAIAVLAVVLYHADFAFGAFNPFKGGFLGVDIFFVISGYLITSIILREVQVGQFSFANFYERRARRILPALFVVMLVSLPFGWKLLLPVEFIDYSTSILTSLFFGSNFYFWQGDSYWGEVSALRPFLHTWSLSVEEQFYVFFPILVILVWRFAARYLVFILGLFFIVSLVLAEITSVSAPQTAFYLLPARGWELMAGALLAYREVTHKVRVHQKNASRGDKARAVGVEEPLRETVESPRFAAGLAALGLAMILGSIGLFDETIRHPSHLTLVPVMGTVLLIRYAAYGSLVKTLLSNKLVVWVGLISYSLYLWHFPIFAFAKINDADLDMYGKGLAILLSILLALFTYLCIERKTRSKAAMRDRYFFTLIGALFIGLMVANWSVLKNKGHPQRFANFDNLIGYELFDFRQAYMSYTCFLHPENMTAKDPFSKCPVHGAGSDKPVLMLWGDSNAAHLIPGILEVYGNDYQIVIRVSSGCGAFVGFVEPLRPGCREINDLNFEYVINQRPDRLIIAGLWKMEFPALLKKTLSKLQENNFSAVEVIGPVPRWSHTLPRAIIAYGQQNARATKMPTHLKDPRHQDVFEVEQAMQAMTSELGVPYRSMLDILCNDETGCQTYVNNEQLLQWDFGHLTTVGAKFLMREMKRRHDQ